MSLLNIFSIYPIISYLNVVTEVKKKRQSFNRGSVNCVYMYALYIVTFKGDGKLVGLANIFL